MADYQNVRARVVEAMAGFERLISGTTPAASEDLLQQRVQLVQAVNAYLALIKDRIETRNSRRMGDVDLERWRTVYDELVALRQNYSNHIARWSGRNIAAGWREYRSGSYTLLEAMRRHLDEAALCPPLAA